MTVKQADEGMIGGDVNQPLTGAQAKDFVEAGLSFIGRYLPRTAASTKGCLTQPEIQAILSAGLAILPVQHVMPDGWHPDASLGEIYGQFASTYAEQIGIPAGVNIFLDLEGVSSGAVSSDVIAYANEWYDQVNAKGYIPGIYCGWANGLTPGQLYSDLKFKNYWAAYNYTDGVATRGVQIQQHTQKELNGIFYDPDTVKKDLLGDLPFFLFP